MLNGVLWNRQISRKNKLRIYYSILKSTLTYGAQTWKFNKNLLSKLMSMEVDFLGDQRDAREIKFEPGPGSGGPRFKSLSRFEFLS